MYLIVQTDMSCQAESEGSGDSLDTVRSKGKKKARYESYYTKVPGEICKDTNSQSQHFSIFATFVQIEFI